jgi:hypothetical protein
MTAFFSCPVSKVQPTPVLLADFGKLTNIGVEIEQRRRAGAGPFFGGKTHRARETWAVPLRITSPPISGHIAFFAGMGYAHPRVKKVRVKKR